MFLKQTIFGYPEASANIICSPYLICNLVLSHPLYKRRLFLPQAQSFYCDFQTVNIFLPLIQAIRKEYQNFLAPYYIQVVQLWMHYWSFDLY